MSDKLTIIAGRGLQSRLIVGTGKYRSFHEMARCHEATGTDMVTVAVRRVNSATVPRNRCWITSTEAETLLPNTAGCYTADEAVSTALLAREVGFPTGSSWRSSATSAPCSRTTQGCSKPRACW